MVVIRAAAVNLRATSAPCMLAHQASCMLNALVAAATACLTLSFVSCAAEANYGARGEYGPLLKRMSVPEALIMDLFQSSVLPCLEGAAAFPIFCVMSVILRSLRLCDRPVPEPRAALPGRCGCIFEF